MMKPLLMATLCHRGRLFTETIGDLQSAMSILFLLVPNALLKCGGQPIIQVGLLWILHSIKAGLWATCAVWQCFCLLNGASWNSFALWGSFWLGCEHTFFCNFLLLRAYASSPLQDAFIYNMFLVASFALWFCDCVVLLSISLTDDDIKIQRRHIELGNNELKRQLATNDRWAAGTEATKLFSAEFHPNVALSTENGVAKIHWSGDWFEGWICARKRCCRFDKMGNGKLM